MQKDDIKRLWVLLDQLFPRNKESKSEERLLAWDMVLKPYRYEDIKANALAHARKCAYYPTISELTDGIEIKESVRAEDGLAWMDKFIEKRDADLEQIRKEWAK